MIASGFDRLLYNIVQNPYIKKPNRFPNKLFFNPFPNKPWFLRFCSTSLLKTWGKGEIARNEQFLLFPQCFYPFGKLSAIFIKFEIVVCKLF